MSGGRSGGRGYLIQTLVAVLDSLDDERRWHTLALEADPAAEKVDIRWEEESRVRVVQVKSSQNQIGKADVESWASGLADDTVADVRELVLVGPASQSVVEMGTHAGVIIRPPLNLDLNGLAEQAAQRLGIYLEARQYEPMTSIARDLVARALASKLGELSTTGARWSRSGMEDQLLRWAKEVEPLRFRQSASWREQAVQLRIKEETAQVIGEWVPATRACGCLVGSGSVAVISVTASEVGLWGLELGWMAIGAIVVFLWYATSADYVRLMDMAASSAGSVFMGAGKLGTLQPDRSYLVAEYVGERCVYPVDCAGTLRLVAPPERRQPHQTCVAICSQAGRHHSYRVDPNGWASPDPDMDWRPLPREKPS